MPATLRPGDVHLEKLLTNVGARYHPVGFVGDEIYPVVNVKNETDYYATFYKGAWFRDEIGAHGPFGPGSSAIRINFNMKLDNSYTAKEYKAAFPLSRRTRNNADTELGIAAHGAELATRALMLARERRIATSVFAEDTWGTGSSDPTISPTWDNYTTSDPIGEIDAGSIYVRELTGGLPANTCVMGPQVWDQLRRHPEILELCFGSGSDRMIVPTTADFGRAFGFDKVLIGYGMYTASEETNTTTEGTTAPTLSYIWGKNMWIGHVAGPNNMFNPSAGYQLRVSYKVRGWYDEDTDTDFVEASEIVAEQRVAVDCGYYIPSCVA